MRLTLYYRENCHLCESFRLALQRLRDELNLQWDEIDIDRDTDLVFRYDTLVPVLCLGDRELCHYFLDEQALREALESPLPSD